MLDAVPCSSSEECYSFNVPYVFHNIKGLLVKDFNGYFKDTLNSFLSKHKTFWENDINKFGTWNSKVALYYIPKERVSHYSNAENLCRTLGIQWRLPLLTEVSNDKIPPNIGWTHTGTTNVDGWYVYGTTTYSHNSTIITNGYNRYYFYTQCVR